MQWQLAKYAAREPQQSRCNACGTRKLVNDAVSGSQLHCIRVGVCCHVPRIVDSIVKDRHEPAQSFTLDMSSLYAQPCKTCCAQAAHCCNDSTASPSLHA
jgi:hypothetical protein